MGEIKSTLDIIMEKTKGLTLTEEEKNALREKEVEGKVKGLLLKFIDGRMDLENLKIGITAIEEKNPGVAREAVIKDCLSRIDPESDNSLVFEILEHVARADTASFQKPLSKFHRDLDQEKRIREQRLGEKIVEKGISGSAVLPNIRADEEWIHYVQNAKEKFQEEMKSLF
jgi:hypothetical protein